MNSSLLLSLIMAHVIADFYLQRDKDCMQKQALKLKSPFLYLHAAIVGALSWLFVPTFSFAIWALTIALTHLAIDATKSFFRPNLFSFLGDQFMHLAILAATAILFKMEIGLPIDGIDLSQSLSIPLLLVVVLLVMKPTNILIKLVLEKYEIGETDVCKEIKNAGALIGSLERILTLIFVLIGQYGAIGFIIAAKSLLRFKDTDTAKTEYVLAGTLLSFGVAVLGGICLKQLT
ncbi:MAG: DUF3307 domain-containing protein [Phocaeicola sp.]